MKYLKYDFDTGKVITFYDPDIHDPSLFDGCIRVTDYIWSEYISNQGKYVVDIINSFEDFEYGLWNDIFIPCEQEVTILPYEPSPLELENMQLKERLALVEEVINEMILGG